MLGIGGLLAITPLAYLLDALTTPLVRIYEGYWPKGRLTEWAHNRQQKAAKAAIDNNYAAFYYNFPRDPALLRPTRLGNVFAATEDYPYQLYRLNSVIWWPRLTTLLPETFRSQLDNFFVPVVTLLNLGTIFTLLALGCGITVLFVYVDWWLLVPSCVIGLLLARACYSAAVNQAMNYGKMVRVAFDHYRHEILKQMHLSAPDNLVDERLLWDSLNTWIYYYIPPWEAKTATKMPQLARPFYYDTHQQSMPLNVSSEGHSKKGELPSSPSTEDEEIKTES